MKAPTPLASYAVIQTSGKQFRVSAGDLFEVNRVDAAEGASVILDQVLLARPNGEVRVGRPLVPGAKVVCEVVSHGRGPKTITFKYRRRDRYKRKVGHRQDTTRLRVKEIQL